MYNYFHQFRHFFLYTLIYLNCENANIETIVRNEDSQKLLYLLMKLCNSNCKRMQKRCSYIQNKLELIFNTK